MNRVLLALVVLFMSSTFAFSQLAYSEEQFRVFDASGNPATIEQIVNAIGDSDVVFLGEQHDDSVAHAIQAEIFRRVVARYAAERKIALSLEMFERDVQIVVNEYLNGQITEAQFLASSRPWKNYKTDYRPLVELAREKKLPVIAANAPRRYVNMVSRGGRETLNSLSKEAKRWIAPLPYGEPSAAYSAKFKALMGPSPEAQMGIDKILASQSLWDATMSNSVSDYLKRNKKPLVIHLNGAFHTESRLGTVEHLLKYRPKTKALVVTMRYEGDYKIFDKTKDTGIGDFVILTERRTNGEALLTVLRHMENHFSSLKSLRSDLTMVKYDGLLKVEDTLSGSISLLPRNSKLPFYARIDWKGQSEEQIVMIGDMFELYKPRLGQVLQGGVGRQGLSKYLGFISMSMQQLKANYSLFHLGEVEIGNGMKASRLEMIPTSATTYKKVEAWADGDGMLRKFKIYEHSGDTTSIALTNIEKNVLINTEIFKLQYPRNVKKIRV